MQKIFQFFGILIAGAIGLVWGAFIVVWQIIGIIVHFVIMVPLQIIFGRAYFKAMQDEMKNRDRE